MTSKIQRAHWFVFIFSILVPCLLPAAALLSGCSRVGLGVQRAESPTVSPSARVELFKPAKQLTGKTLSWLTTAAEQTVSTIPLHSGLIRDVALQASPAVVSIFTHTRTDYRFKLLPGPTSGLSFSVDGEALGSGFFIHSSGYLLTNNHVLENATLVVARTADDKNYELEVVAKDPVYDLALLKVKEADQAFSVLAMGRSDEATVGDWVVAIGNPLGLGHTVTHGIISQTGRELNPELKEGERQIEFLQTDTPINPGSSGGPLVTLTGAWVGVNTAVIVNSQGISFCVPQSQVEAFLLDVLNGNGDWIP